MTLRIEDFLQEFAARTRKILDAPKGPIDSFRAIPPLADLATIRRIPFPIGPDSAEGFHMFRVRAQAIGGRVLLDDGELIIATS